jgi:hypothetical protein
VFSVYTWHLFCDSASFREREKEKTRTRIGTLKIIQNFLIKQWARGGLRVHGTYWLFDVEWSARHNCEEWPQATPPAIGPFQEINRDFRTCYINTESTCVISGPLELAKGILYLD